MRTLGFRTHVIVAVAAAAALLGALARPWYGVPAEQSKETGIGELDGPLNSLWSGITRAFHEHTGVSGSSALGSWGHVIAALALLAGALALLSLVPAVQGVTRELLRYVVLVIVGIVLWKLIDPPGRNGNSELRYGALAAAAAAFVLAWAGLNVASAPIRRHVEKPRYEAPPPPPAWDFNR